MVVADPPASAKPPGPILLAFTVIPLVALIREHYGWWPSPFGEFRWLDPILVSAVALLISSVVGLVWAIRTLYVLGQDRRWSWWILPSPVAIIAVVAAVLLMPPATFLDKSGEFETIAIALLEQPGSTLEELEIGQFDISSAHVVRPGEVYFIDNDSMFITSSGRAYAPSGPPSGFDDFSATHLGGPWYEFTAVWRD
ncbi:DUF1109 domain-containing protein [Rhodococcus sp. IEGM 1318]|uniref:DUF1109 domain-containing protein n=1 Tax=Rhodococcus sp. IEGM 1318 TaxID=3082226 RepID=UPI0029556503|nr:DUF1109 domain-containing protein [Rhodococcus sp. IEGM 1318]MDV8007771.1 DUF1109 domain-containing protein [Rhodococcus sp. IEGM 1318]